MQSGGWQMIGMAGLLWLMMSDTIDRLIPVPSPRLDPTVLRAGIPGLVETEGQPDLPATLDRLRAAAVADPQSSLGARLIAADKFGSATPWPDLLRNSDASLNLPIDGQLLEYDRLMVLQQVLDSVRQLEHPTSKAAQRAGAALREQPPDPTYAATLILDWYAAAITAVRNASELPSVPAGSPRLATWRALPLAEQMVHPLTVSERSQATSEYLVNTLLAKRRQRFISLQGNPGNHSLAPTPVPSHE